MKLMRDIDERAQGSRDNSREIISQITSNVTDEEVSALAQYKSLRNKIIKSRNLSLEHFVPKNHDIPDILKRNFRDFLIYDSNTKDQYHFIIFGIRNHASIT